MTANEGFDAVEWEQGTQVGAITVLHPGAMGAAVGREAGRRDARVLWCPDGRSEATRRRADQAGLHPAGSLAEALTASSVVLSVCPPAFAEDVAGEVCAAAAASGFRGIFLEANAVSPERSMRIAMRLADVGVRCVDGGIIGPPPQRPGSTRLYLSGDAEAADAVTEVFSGGLLEAVVLDRPVGAASGLKLAYASYQKARRALAAVSHALAAEHDVGEQLSAEAERMNGPALADLAGLSDAAAKAWRWAPEMGEAAAALSAAGLPAHLARAAEAVMGHWEDDRDRYDIATSEVLDHLRRPAGRPVR